jgi:hypothetical protein
MITPSTYKGDLSDELIADDVYGYTNNIARYALRFIPVHNIECKYNFVCERNKLNEELSLIIDQWYEPDQMDILDLTVCTYTKHHYMVAWFHPYKIEIELLEVFNNVFDNEKGKNDANNSEHNKDGGVIPFQNLS